MVKSEQYIDRHIYGKEKGSMSDEKDRQRIAELEEENAKLKDELESGRKAAHLLCLR